jgi:hypothetical protein
MRVVERALTMNSGDDGPRGARGVLGPTGLKGFPGAVVRYL